ncbi:MAG TPA: cytochrome c oxidase subunit II [Chloroflexota bacterium]|nr:cytochrome c oxidase subunit II [Chloroflexota bacterium]
MKAANRIFSRQHGWRSWRRWVPPLLALAADALAAGLARAQDPGFTLNPAGPPAHAISNLFNIVLLMSLAVLLLVWGLLAYCIWRFRARPGAAIPRQVQGNMRLEIGWTLAPVVVLAVLAVLELPTIFGAAAAQPNALTVVATGNRFWWGFEYPDQGVVTANELHIPVGVPVRVQLRSADVIHALWIPRLNGKTDMVPGQTNEMWLQASTPDVYVGQCSELCGIQHAGMLLRVIAEPQDQFNAWLAREAAPAAAPTSDPARQGQQVFQTNACGDCHTVKGTAAAGTAGPDLTHVASRQTLASGVIPNTPEQLRRWLDNPQVVKPGAFMPTFRLSDTDLAALTAYLDELR